MKAFLKSFFSCGGTIILQAVLMLMPVVMYGQLCTGSLGDPVVDINFGAGSSTHGAALSTSITNYTYSSNSFPYDGSYTIENTTAGAGSVWWSTTDHTGNAGGYMMVVNANVSVTNYFYKNTVTGLCPGTTYEFAAWVINLLRSQDNSPPNITFTISTTNDSLLASYTTGQIPLTSSPTWKQYGMYFTTPPGVTSVKLLMKDIAGGGAPANDLALDDITFRACGPVVTATIDGNDTAHVCVSTTSPVTLRANVSTGYTNPEVQWQINTGAGWSDISGGTSATYVYTAPALTAGGTLQFRAAAAEGSNINTTNCRVWSNAVTLVTVPPPVARYGLSRPVCAGHYVQFLDSSVTYGPVYYHYTFGDGDSSNGRNPIHIYTNTGTYSTDLIVTSVYGCADTAAGITVTVNPLPTANFTATPVNTSIFDPNVTITDLSSADTACTIYWGDAETSPCSEATHTYAESGTYNIMQVVVSDSGCTDTAYFTIIKRPEFRLFIPNAFTPNGDGNNDVFKPNSIGVFDFTMSIFNRWGEKIFESENIDNGWDGTYKSQPQLPGVYVYVITLFDKVTLKSHHYEGSVTLLK